MKINEITTNLKNTVSPTYIQIQSVYNDMVKNNTPVMSWNEFQKRYQRVSQKYSNEINAIRNDKAKISIDDLKNFLSRYPQQSKYPISYDSYYDADHSYRAVKQTVLQINRSAAFNADINMDPLVSQYVKMVGQSSQMSEHPVSINTIGWVRVDEISKKWLLIDEIQSDLVNSVLQAKAIINSKSYEDFAASLSDAGRKMFYDKISKAQFNQSKVMLPRYGYTIEKLESIRKQLIELTKDWAEEAMSSIIHIATQEHIENIALHTSESISARDPLIGAEASKMKIYYDNIARQYGFEKQQVNDGPLKGLFWVKNLKATR